MIFSIFSHHLPQSIGPNSRFGSALSHFLPFLSSQTYRSRRFVSSSCNLSRMVLENPTPISKTKHAKYRLCNVAGYKTDLLEIHAQDPKLHVLFIPGNPGVASFYVDFLESLYELLGGTVSVTVILKLSIFQLSHTYLTAKSMLELNISPDVEVHIKNWELGRLFSLQAQIDHKMNFIEQEFHNVEVPIILVGHSIGSYISLEVFKRLQKEVGFCIGLYPFLTVNTKSWKQSFIKKIAASRSMSAMLSSVVACIGMLPAWISTSLVKNLVAKSWSPLSVDALCTHLLHFHAMQNVLFMAMTEFDKLSEELDWPFMRQKRNKMAFLFGLDDHWGPTHVLEEICEKVPEAVVTVEQEGHTHAFCCTEAGSLWAAKYVSSLIKKRYLL